MNTLSVRKLMGGVVAALIGTLAWTGSAVGSEPLETGLRDINLEPVKVTEDTTVEDLLRGYTDEELAAAEKVVSHAEELPLPTPVPRDVNVTGVVFLDKNANGTLDPDEEGMPDIAVSDGDTIKRTGSDGRFSYSLRAGGEVNYRFVFATRPTGFKPTTRWFLRIPFADDATEYTAEFGFAEDAASAKPDFWFITVSDSQFSEANGMIPTAKDYAQITSAPGNPAFLFTIGDLTQNGTHKEFDKYDRIRGASNIPVYDGFGGHDGVFARPLLTTANFEQHIGPAYYSFEYGGVHFVFYVDETYFLVGKAHSRMLNWLKVYFKSLPKGAPVIMASHRPMVIDWYDTKREEGINLIGQLAGHYHLVMEGSRGGVPVIITAPSRGSDQGAYSRTYRWVHVTPEGINTELRVAGQYKRLELLAPGSKAVQGKQSLVVLAYDSALKVRQSTCRVTSPTGKESSPTLTQEGDWGWGGAIDLDTPGTWRFSLQADDSAGGSWQREQTIEVSRESMAKARVGDDFPWLLAGTPTRRLKTGPIPPLYPLWVRHTGSVHVMHSTPAVADGRVFVPVTNPNVGGTDSGVLCLDAKTGKKIWFSPSPQGDMRGPITVRDGRVFAVTAESWAVAYDAETGAMLWSRALDPLFELGNPQALNRTSPVPTSHGLLVCAEDVHTSTIDAYPGPFLLDYATGETIMKIPIKTWVYYRGFPTVFNDVVYSLTRSLVQAVRIPSGEVVWEKKSGAKSMGPGIVAQGKLLFGTSNGLIARDVESGEKLWTGPSGGAVYLQPVPVVWDDLVLLSGRSFFGVDLATGETRFEVKHSTDRSRFERSRRQRTGSCSTPVIAGEVAYYGHDDTAIRAIKKTGEVVWEYVVGTPIKTSPFITGNLLFVHDLAGYLWCFGPAESI